MTARISHLYCYPIKSTIGNSLRAAQVTPRGLQYDRQWGLFDKEGVALTGRKYQDLLRINTVIANGQLQISLDRNEKFSVPVDAKPDGKVPVKIFSGRTYGIPISETIDTWFSELLQQECQFLHIKNEIDRPVLAKHGGREGDRVNFADQCPILLLSEASLADLNSKMNHTIDYRHFRPNIVISGNPAFSEDEWQQIRIGECTFTINQSCERCVFTTINPDTREKHPQQEPLRTLLTYRRNTRGGPIFGVHMTARQLGTIRVGDRVEVLS